MQKIRAIFSWLLSFRKTNWTIDDYPIRLRKQVVEPYEQHGRLKPVVWSAQIINWWQMAGHGETEDAAFANLRENFERFREAHERLPRPGTGAPLEFSSANLIEQHEEIARDFLIRILNLNYDECFISDESSLWDFHCEDTNEEYYRKIVQTYDIDVSDVPGAKLGLIFERIATKQTGC